MIIYFLFVFFISDSHCFLPGTKFLCCDNTLVLPTNYTAVQKNEANIIYHVLLFLFNKYR